MKLQKAWAVLALVIFTAFYAQAQTPIQPTAEFTVTGQNEIFNSPTGDHLYIVIEKAGEKIDEMDERILLVTTSDFKTGRRHIKALSRIMVGRVE